MVKLLVVVLVVGFLAWGTAAVARRLPALCRRYLTRGGRHAARMERLDSEMEEATLELERREDVLRRGDYE